MALVSARKNRLARVLARTRLTRKPNVMLWAGMILTIFCAVVVPILLVFEAISIGLDQGTDAVLRWYVSEFFSGSSIELVYFITGSALVICLIWSLCVVIPFIRLKLYKHPRFRRHTRDYRRELPSAEIHPVVVSRFLNEQQLPDDIFIALLHLAALDVVRITRSLDESSSGYHLPSVKTGFFIDTKPTAATQHETEKALTSNIDRAAFRALCSLADDNGVVTLEQLIKAIEQDFFQSNSPLSVFSRCASRELVKADLVQKRGAFRKEASIADLSTKWLLGVLYASIPWIIFGIICWCFNAGFLPLMWSAVPPIALALLLWNLFEFDITDDGYRVLDECRACKRWMEDFTALRQAQAGATVTWDDYLTYAYVLEVNETLVADMWQAGGAVIENISTSFIAKNGRPHFWWSRSKRLAYKRKWNSVLEDL